MRSFNLAHAPSYYFFHVESSNPMKLVWVYKDTDSLPIEVWKSIAVPVSGTENNISTFWLKHDLVNFVVADFNATSIFLESRKNV